MADGLRAMTIKDVAAAAGVGVATVSRVLSGQGSVSPRTRERVLAAARRLDYRPSALGRSLKLQRTGSIGLVLPDITDPFCAALAGGVLDCARTLGEHVILDAAHEDPVREAEIVNRLMEQRVDGIIAMPVGEPGGAAAGGRDEAGAGGGTVRAEGGVWQAAVRVGLAVVFADRGLAGLPAVPTVLADDRAGVRSVAEYLVGLGHRRIGFLGGAGSGVPGGPGAGGPVPGVREEAFRETLRDLRVPADDELIVGARSSRDSAYAAAASLFQRRPDVTAVLAAGHLLGEAAVLAARELNLRVPADVSIAMVDDVPWAELCDPPLTVVARPAADLGYRACEVLLRDRTRREQGRPVVLPTELVVRGSCGPPAAGAAGGTARSSRPR